MVLLIRNAGLEVISTARAMAIICFYLYAMRASRSSIRFCIYIPLWFYLYGLCGFPLHLPDRIYIPLWFYLYLNGRKIQFPVFHLHSTMVLLIPVIFLRFSSVCNFIYIPLWFYLYCPVLLPADANRPNLHSTMVLLILGICCRPIYHIKIYIPLWFYLYQHDRA